MGFPNLGTLADKLPYAFRNMCPCDPRRALRGTNLTATVPASMYDDWKVQHVRSIRVSKRSIPPCQLNDDRFLHW